MPEFLAAAAGVPVALEVAITPLGDEDSGRELLSRDAASRRASAAPSRTGQNGATPFPATRRKVDSFRLNVALGYSDGNSYEMTTFGSAVAVSFTYREDQLNYWAVHESTLRIMRSDDDGATWLDVPTTIDVASKTATAQTTQPGTFALTGVRHRTTLITVPDGAPLPDRRR